MKYVEFPEDDMASKDGKNKNKSNNRNASQGGSPSGGWFWTILWTILFLFLLNGLFFPGMKGSKVVETDYGQFVKDVSDSLVREVVIKDNKVYYSKGTEANDTTYFTGEVNDPELVNRLVAAGSPNLDGKIKFVKKIEQKNSPILDFILWWILPALIFYLIYVFMMRKIASRGGAGGGMGNFMSLGKSGAKVYAEDDIKTRFSDVAGQDEAKESLKEMVDFLHNPKKYTALGAKLPKGALLVGPPGTGKTLIARAVAGEAEVPFFSMSGSEFVQMFVGMGAAKVRDLFEQANKKAPCIIFIDEIDAIGKSREGSLSTNDEREQTLNQLLTEMDGFDANKGVVILAATNRPDSLDKALLRPGRFDRRIQMELPDLEGRKAILKVHLKNVKHEDIELDVVARATAGSSGADLANIVNEGALRAVREGKKAVTTDDLEESVETVMAGEQRKNAVISPEEKKIIAYHEIGHAMVAAVQSNSAPVHKITIIPRTSGALGYTMQVDEGEKYLYSKEYLTNRIATLTGGRVAEEVICDTCTTGASNDIEQATKMARAMIMTYGMSDKFGMVALQTRGNAYLGSEGQLACSDEIEAQIDEEVRSMIGNAKEKAKQIITSNIDKMHEAANYLIEKETITGEEFMNILNKK
ncbi:MAG: ATP-dependent zinc metalloprotease FtsH [Bacteroidales bacterium]|nr:ATP-dependent zinc metalloprotease FtsH [Bacteroidales bacterium]MDY6000819.1 ATP-dependent zinc metalloprotease FtsH [Candidatus Cryptobacteroides sp.]